MGWFFEASSLAGWQLLVRVLAGVSGPAVVPRTRDLEFLRLQAWLAGRQGSGWLASAGQSANGG